MIDMKRYSTHRVYPRDGHRFIKGFALNDDSITLKYYNGQSEAISVSDLIWLYNDAIYNIGYYQEKADELEHELISAEHRLDILQDQLDD